ncbi:hypothetical protein XELAEV_18006787mg [Xenopus laevis]|uniref:GIY-YIG domain-containing protein n=1 Tax=Xenopus laevis TaxID=8355 RepID=A0A974E0R5_XENLA|nr:hypothetical protein XELAEV_18006787mg [Xenopus laevis]
MGKKGVPSVNILLTSRPVKERIKEHRSNIRNFKVGTQTYTPISRHFSSFKHNLSQLKWQVIEVICKPQRGGNMLKLLLQEEAKWIKKLNSLHPEGLNEHWSISSFL